MSKIYHVEQMLELLREAGFGDLTAIEGGASERARSYRFMTGPWKSLLIMSVNQNGVVAVQLFAGFSEIPTLEGINAWNEQRRFVKAYATDMGVALEMDFIAVDTTRDALEAYFAMWAGQIGEAPNFDWGQ